jgi:hypothetical protein
MKTVSKELFDKIFHITEGVKNNLQKKGIIIPIENSDGSISFGHFIVKRDADGFYNILDYSNTIVVKKINLPQTAILLANSLALGKYLDQVLLDLDQQYGYTLFEESLCKKIKASKKSTLDKIDLILAKSSTLELKRESLKKQITSKFEKLRKII